MRSDNGSGIIGNVGIIELQVGRVFECNGVGQVVGRFWHDEADMVVWSRHVVRNALEEGHQDLPDGRRLSLVGLPRIGMMAVAASAERAVVALGFIF